MAIEYMMRMDCDKCGKYSIFCQSCADGKLPDICPKCGHGNYMLKGGVYHSCPNPPNVPVSDGGGRFDLSGRDVTDTPGLWSDEDVIAPAGWWIVWAEKQTIPMVCSPKHLQRTIAKFGLLKSYKILRLGKANK